MASSTAHTRAAPPSAPSRRTAPPQTRLQAVGVDWGTTHRRGYAIGADGRCLAEHADADGMLAARGRFGASLRTLLQALGAEELQVPVLMSGMVGSAHGWVEVPYLEAPLDLRSLASHLFEMPTHLWDEATGAGQRRPSRTAPPRSVHIVPGCVLRTGGRVDVMRGEETQLLGAVGLGHRDGWFLLPGTHS